MTITTVLLDADGVVQRNHAFAAGVAEILGVRATRQELLEIERTTLTGHGDLRAQLAAFLAARAIPATPDDLLTVWLATQPVPGVLSLVDQVRARGVPVHLATNQNPIRGRHMLEALGYEGHFDSQFHSFQIGLAKPDPAFFTYIISQLGIEPGHTLFVDDAIENVDSARTVGLIAAHLDRDAGALGLAAILRDQQLLD